jgi:hypothetical protein
VNSLRTQYPQEYDLFCVDSFAASVGAEVLERLLKGLDWEPLKVRERERERDLGSRIE